MTTVVPITRTMAFEPEMTQAMALAYECACRELHRLGHSTASDEMIARSIIESARSGERDPARMQAHAMRVHGAA